MGQWGWWMSSGKSQEMPSTAITKGQRAWINPGQWVQRGTLVPLGGHPIGVIMGAVKIVILWKISIPFRFLTAWLLWTLQIENIWFRELGKKCNDWQTFIRLSLCARHGVRKCFMSLFPLHTHCTAVTQGHRVLLDPFYRWGKRGLAGLSLTLSELGSASGYGLEPCEETSSHPRQKCKTREIRAK